MEKTKHMRVHEYGQYIHMHYTCITHTHTHIHTHTHKYKPPHLENPASSRALPNICAGASLAPPAVWNGVASTHSPYCGGGEVCVYVCVGVCIYVCTGVGSVCVDVHVCVCVIRQEHVALRAKKHTCNIHTDTTTSPPPPHPPTHPNTHLECPSLGCQTLNQHPNSHS